MTEEIVKPTRSVLALRPDLADAVRKYAQASQAENTRRAYETARREFEAFCDEHDVSAWPSSPETVAAYLSDLAEKGYAYATIVVRRAAIATFHRVVLQVSPAPTSDPRVKAVMGGIRRTKGTTPAKQRDPLMWATLPLVFEKLPSRALEAHRDKALLLFGVTSAMRGAEIRNVMMEDLKFYAEGLVVHIRKSKTDQTSKGRIVRIPHLDKFGEMNDPLCPVCSLRVWLDYAQIESGPIFRSIYCGGNGVRSSRLGSTTIWEIVKRAVTRAGFDATSFGSHSLRAGFVTSARRRGISWGDIMEQTGHKQLATVMKYERPTEDDAPAWDRARKPFESDLP